jgi:hypothetical protein
MASVSDDKEIVDQIQDIIVNNYEDDGHIYTKAELAEILDAIVEVVDTRR